MKISPSGKYLAVTGGGVIAGGFYNETNDTWNIQYLFSSSSSLGDYEIVYAQDEASYFTLFYNGSTFLKNYLYLDRKLSIE